MYNKEITKLINENFRLDSTVAALLKDFNETSDTESLNRAEEIQEQIFQNHTRIDRMRGEN